MIAEIKFKNIFSFRDETLLSFEADKSKDMESYHVVDIAPDLRLLKFGVIYGANASGKSNFIKGYNFFSSFITRVPRSKSDHTGVMPFLLNKESKSDISEISLVFYLMDNESNPVKCVYNLRLKQAHVCSEMLVYYPTQQPAILFERSFEDGVSTIKFGNKIKLSNAAKEEITLKCLPNMSVFAAYMQVNVNVPEIERILAYFKGKTMYPIASFMPDIVTKYDTLKDDAKKDYILNYLKEADFNISDIYSQDSSSEFVLPKIMYQHTITNNKGDKELFDFPEQLESDGTLRTMEISSRINELIQNNAFLTIDEIESSLHPKLVEYVIERFLQESTHAQMLVTTHYDGLLAQEDLLRKDNIWFTEKGADGASILYPLTDFKALNRISSLQKAYKFGKFGAIPNI